MPLQYPGGIIGEHLHCREQAGLFDISHMGLCQVSGDDVSTELERLTPSTIRTLQPGQQRYTVLTNAQGGILDDIVITRLPEGFMLVVNSACKEKDFNHLYRHFGSRLKIMPDQALFALQGPKAADVIQQLAPEACKLKFMQCCHADIDKIPCLISRSGYTGEDGFEIAVSAKDARMLAETLLSFDQVKPIGLGARDSLRLEAGLSLYGHELTENTTPVETGLGWLIAKDNHNFPGAKIIHEQLRQGAPRKRIGLLIDGKQPVREHSEIHKDSGRKVGFVTSGGFAPSLKRPIALALIDSRCADQTLYSTIRNKTITLRVTATPFVPHRYHRG